MKKKWLILVVVLMMCCSIALVACNNDPTPPVTEYYYAPVAEFKNGDFEVKKVRGDGEESVNDGHVTRLSDWTIESEAAWTKDSDDKNVQWATSNAWISDVYSGFDSGMWVRTANNSLKLEGSSDNPLEFTMSQKIANLAAGKYALVFYVYANNTDNTINQVGGTGSATSTADSVWTRNEFIYDHTAAGELNVGFEIESMDKAYIDSVGLYKVSETEFAAADKVTLAAPEILDLDLVSRKLTWDYVPYAESYLVTVTKDGAAFKEFTYKNDLTAAKPQATNIFEFNKQIPSAGLGVYSITVKAVNETTRYAINTSAASTASTITIKSVKSIDLDLVLETDTGREVTFPSMVDVTYSDDTKGQEPAQWYPNEVENLYITQGDKTVQGVVDAIFETGVSNEVSATVKVHPQYIKNGYFTDSNFNNWTVTIEGEESTEGLSFGGWGSPSDPCLVIQNDSVYGKEIILTQEVGIVDLVGLVDLVAGDVVSLNICVKGADGNDLSFDINGTSGDATFDSTNFNIFRVEYTITADDVTKGTVTVSITTTPVAWGMAISYITLTPVVAD